MPRPARRTRERRALSSLEREYLLRGYWTGGRGLEPSIAELVELWKQNSEEILGLEGSENDFPLGCAPWAFWVFSCGLDGFPKSQAIELEKRGYLTPEEKIQTIASAREQLRGLTRAWRLEARVAAEEITDDELLQAWPGIPSRAWDIPRLTRGGSTA